MASQEAMVLVLVLVTLTTKDAGPKFDASAYISAAAGYDTAPNGRMLSFPFNSFTPIFCFNKDAFKATGLPSDKAPSTWPEHSSGGGQTQNVWP